MDKATAENIDRQWELIKKNREKVKLAQQSSQLISVYELGKLWLSLKEGECLVLAADGSIHRGEKADVPTSDMQKLKDVYKTERHIDLLRVESDLKSAMETYPTLGGTKRANNWDTRNRLANGTRVGRKRKSEPALPADSF